MFKLEFYKHQSVFKKPSGTSRGVLLHKDSWILSLSNSEKSDCVGLGEVSVIEGLSYDCIEEIPEQLAQLAKQINSIDFTDLQFLNYFPAIRFGLEMAYLDWLNGGKQEWFKSEFTAGRKAIPINGLIWMGTFEAMHQQIQDKLNAGFNCIKLKVGAIDFEQELSLLKEIRKNYTSEAIEIRLDANGAFKEHDVFEKLKRLSDCAIHSIEQPIKQGQWELMRAVTQAQLIPIALDEELIGVPEAKYVELLTAIQPTYIILKPSLLGGFKASEAWVNAANKTNIAWWATSALETNLGLNAIAQWTAIQNNPLPQGLGTGSLFTTNFESPLSVRNGHLYYAPDARA